jgi:exodeoxyribonuclease V
METALMIPTDNELKLNEQQEAALTAMKKHALSKEQPKVFILNGAAGTGKTTLLKTFAEMLDQEKMDYKLLAPTGRAAKVLSKSTNKKTTTLHSFIYVIEEKEIEGQVKFKFIPRENNLTKPCVMIVDEASMVSDLPADNEHFLSDRSLLNDLLIFLDESPEGSKILFVGDHYQLPPVNESISVALSPDHLRAKYNIEAQAFYLTEVLRQNQNSYIYRNAQMLRGVMDKGYRYSPKLSFKNMYRTDLAVQQFCKYFDLEDASKTIFLGWKNVTVAKLNQTIRKNLFKSNNEMLFQNEQIVLHRTHYNQHYLPTGETGKVLSFNTSSIEDIEGSKFGEAVFQFEMPTGEHIEITRKFDIGFLISDKNEESVEQNKKLYAHRKKNNKAFRDSNNPADDPYLSALKIKYGYAITTHKAQGGEWENVFLYPEYPFDENRLRWIYTSVTRAKNHLYSF